VTDKLAVDGGPRTRTEPFPPWPVFDWDDGAAVAETLRSGHLTQLTGYYVRDFEHAFAEWHGTNNCIATSSGTTAIHTALIALDVGPGDEVIVPAHTFIASATPVLHQRAKPIFADVDENTFCISPDSVHERLTSRTKAIIAVHLNGHPADLDPLRDIAEERGVALIEDAAQAHGALYKSKWVGTLGRVGCFSFWEDKIITTGGEGGAIITDDDTLADRMRRIRHHGEGPIEGERAYYHLELGYNYRMTSLQAVVGVYQLRSLAGYLENRRRNANYLSERLGELPHITPPFVADYAVHSYYKYICKLAPYLDIQRFVQAVSAEGVPISRRYPTPLPQQPVFRDMGLSGLPCPTAEKLAGELFTLLVHPTATTNDMDDYVKAISKVLEGLGE